MIIDDPGAFFIFVMHPDSIRDSGAYIACRGVRLTNKEYMDHWGKWIVMDQREKLDELAAKLDYHVERKQIPCIKYDRYPPPMFELGVCVMCVFCDDRERDEVWEILHAHGVDLQAWVYDRITVEMWQPGGMLLETWITSNGLIGQEAERVREDARRQIEETYGREDAICTGWGQVPL